MAARKTKLKYLLIIIPVAVVLAAAVIFFPFGSKTEAFGTVVHDQGKFFTVYVPWTLTGAPAGLYHIPVKSVEDPPALENGDLVEIHYEDIIGDKYKLMPSEPAYFKGVSDIKIRGRTFGLIYNGYAAKYEAYLADDKRYHNPTVARDFEGYGDAEGTVVSISPLTVYISEPFLERGIYPGFHIPKMYNELETVNEIETGHRLKITFLGCEMEEPRYLYDTTDIEILGKVGDKEYADIYEMYEDHQSREEFFKENQAFPDYRVRQDR